MRECKKTEIKRRRERRWGKRVEWTNKLIGEKVEKEVKRKKGEK